MHFQRERAILGTYFKEYIPLSIYFKARDFQQKRCQASALQYFASVVRLLSISTTDKKEERNVVTIGMLALANFLTLRLAKVQASSSCL